MNKFFLAVLVSLSAPAFATFSFFQESKSIVDLLGNELKACGLDSLGAYDPRLPYPQVSALRAVINSRYQLLAYYDEESAIGGGAYVFKAPNGGSRHSISFGDDGMTLVTPYQGNVAWVNRFKMVDGWHYNFWCRGISGPVTYDYWVGCVKNAFIGVISAQLCRYAR